MPTSNNHRHLLRRLEQLSHAHQRHLITDLELVQELTCLQPSISALKNSIMQAYSFMEIFLMDELGGFFGGAGLDGEGEEVALL